MAKALTGKVALVTGGARGIGAATARALADEGADVAVTYSASGDKAAALVHELEGRGVRAVAFRADQGDATQAGVLVTKVIEYFGALDILVNNAGVTGTGSVGDSKADVAALDRVIAVNLTGVVALVRAAAPRLRDGGRIISVGSVLGHRVPFVGIGDYSATKAALIGYTKAWARDLGARGITVNIVNPGAIDTDMNPADGPYKDYVAQSTPLARYGHASEVATVIAFLAGPGASYVNGVALDIDGGQSA